MANDKLAKVNFNAGNNVPEKNQNLTRTGIQFSLAPVVAGVFSKLAGEGYDPMGNVAHARRTLRAMMVLALKPLLSMGAPRDFMLAQLEEALDSALAEHKADFKAQAGKMLAAEDKGKALPSPMGKALPSYKK